MKRVMWIEHKVGDGLAGPARIGWVTVKDRGKPLEYKDQIFRTLGGQGFKSNYYDIQNREEYWISGCRKDGRDALYNTTAEIDEDALEEYWVNTRNLPENSAVTVINAQGKYK